MTNAVFKCAKPDGQNRTVLLRSYGEGTELFFSREMELAALGELAERGLVPALLATFHDGRVEEFLHARTFCASDMRDPALSQLVARRLAQLHTVDLGGGPQAAASKTPSSSSPGAAGEEPSFAAQSLEAYHRHALARCGQERGGLRLAELGRLVAEEKRRLLDGPACARPPVFCHNDLQYGNLMVRGDSRAGGGGGGSGGGGEGGLGLYAAQEEKGALAPSVEAAERAQAGRAGGGPGGRGGGGTPAGSSPELFLIDYEYAGYNPRGYDLANHFNEWMADYAGPAPHESRLDRFPTAEERRVFYHAYLEEGARRRNGGGSAGAGGGGGVAVAAGAVPQEEVEALEEEVMACLPVCNLLWALWGLVLSEESSCVDFDYLGFAQQRMRAFWHFRELRG